MPVRKMHSMNEAGVENNPTTPGKVSVAEVQQELIAEEYTINTL